MCPSSRSLPLGSGSNWRLTKRGTPGNLGSFEDILFANNDMQDSPVIVALIPNFHEPGCIVGLGFVDVAKRVLGIVEILDDSHFINVESALVALGCKECILPIEITKLTECKSLHITCILYSRKKLQKSVQNMRMGSWKKRRPWRTWITSTPIP
ncbi:DNA mismatch repair protein MSH2 [Tanacetum coccineum]